MVKRVYDFEEGNKDMRDLLGGKGANLAEMTNLGLRVPPGFIITTKTCKDFFEAGGEFPEGLWEEVLEHVRSLEKRTGKSFGDPENPLLVSVRSGAPVSMPGMMDTVLNLGLNDEVAASLVKLTGEEWFVYDAYRRLITMFGDVVMDAEREKFDEVHREEKKREGAKGDTEISVEGLKRTVEGQKRVYEKEVGDPFPTDPYEQLELSIAAVFNSWNIPRAVTYRRAEGIPDDMGTACNVQIMVFGNMGWDSGSGVLFTRDPANGDRGLFGELLFNAQGEDVVAGIRTPIKIAELQKEQPDLYEQLEEIAESVEAHYRDMQDMEFTIENGVLYILQTRTGKRTAKSAVKIAVDMCNEGLIDRETALMRVTPNQVDQLLHPQFDPEAKERARGRGDLLTVGLNASPGAATGIVIFDANRAEEMGKAGESVILVRPETTPDDVNGMIVSKGFLTQHGGGTSHAAVVARGWGKPCVAGAEEIRINLQDRIFTVRDRVFKEGDFISIDGATGEVFAGVIDTMAPKFEEEKELVIALAWADEVRSLGVRTNADNPEDSRRARMFGAEGIGLTRTEHMFFDQEGEEISRRENIVKMILQSDAVAPLLRRIADLENRLEGEPGNEELKQEIERLKREAEADPAVGEYRKALDALLPFQRKDFEGIFEAMDGLPVIIRLIDPPMHEFLPPREQLLEDVITLRLTGKDPEQLAEKEKIMRVVESLWETNPMLGLRGCRAGLMYPGLTEMQVKAIFEAACNVAKRGYDVHPEVMIPLTSHINELHAERMKLERVAKQVMAEKGVDLHYMFGTMIEVPRAALTADEIATASDFFSFGTNDLTQMTYGISRDDAEGKFLLNFVDRGLLPANPFQQLDWDGVGQLMKICVEKGRKTNPKLEIGICGEHGGDPHSIDFCHIIGLDYVSCSPYRVPIARLAAAQAKIKYG
ncbi:MAG: pyruvate, phosphate dikinase [Candidatus Bathyarchaeota archaeon]|nr:pyruvate, phosphate dikinase [Candidatus Bathyarchaeota archaeon]MDH5790761.1 pyruvate, phosphate dikinase [Candidatus Bathyarchaeota archaeon]